MLLRYLQSPPNLSERLANGLQPQSAQYCNDIVASYLQNPSSILSRNGVESPAVQRDGHDPLMAELKEMVQGRHKNNEHRSDGASGKSVHRTRKK